MTSKTPNPRLVSAGWKQTVSGRYVHPNLAPVGAGRRRPFTEAEALTLLDSTDTARVIHACDDGVIPDGACPDCGAFECPDAPGVVA